MSKNSVYIGRGKLSCLQAVIAQCGGKKILLVTGKASYDKLPLKSLLEEQLEGCTVLRHCQFSVNPNVTDLIEGAKLKADFDPDLIIGIGGGSVLDTAKLLHVLPVDTDRIQQIIKGQLPVQAGNNTLILLPTTAGSGSEATHFAVVYLGTQKYSVASPYLLPQYTIVDAALTDSMPPYLTAVSGLDALAQAIESYWCVSATEESLTYAEESIKLTLQYLEQAVLAPNQASRDNMSLAAYLAGKAINITKTTAPHALSYGFTQHYGIPHGHAVMLTLPALLGVNTSFQEGMLNQQLSSSVYRARIKQLCTLFQQQSAEEVAGSLEQLMDKLGLKRKLRDFNIAKADLPILVQQVNIERLNNNPIKLTQEVLLRILKTIY